VKGRERRFIHEIATVGRGSESTSTDLQGTDFSFRFE
jgi:hypothetical protein